MTSTDDSPFGQFYRAKINPEQASVALAYCHGDVIRPAFTKSVVNAVVTDRGRHVHAFITSSGLYVPEGRNQIVRQFLEVDQCEWLWFLDTDVSFPPDTLDRMLLATEKGDKKILAASYWSETTERLPYSPWMYLNEDGFHPYLRLPERGTMELASCGMGCTLIHRDVLLDIAKAQDSTDPWVWFGHDLMETKDGLIRAGEDISFCARAAHAGHTTWGLCGLTVDHYKLQPTRQGQASTTTLLPRMATINGRNPIFTGVSEREAECLRQLADKGRVLEIGGGTGYSTIIMARVAERVISVDPHEEIPASWEIINENLDAYDVRDRVELRREPSSEALPDLYASGDRFSLVFVDGDHSMAAVRQDVAWGLKLLAPGGYLACHDYGSDNYPDVRAVLGDIPPLDVVDTLWVHQVDEPPSPVLQRSALEGMEHEPISSPQA